jgi:hypothetical protein
MKTSPAAFTRSVASSENIFGSRAQPAGAAVLTEPDRRSAKLFMCCQGRPYFPRLETFPVPYTAKCLAPLGLISWSETLCAGSLNRTGCFPPSTQKFQRLGVRPPH